jgi:hypothetical protein
MLNTDSRPSILLGAVMIAFTLNSAAVASEVEGLEPALAPREDSIRSNPVWLEDSDSEQVRYDEIVRDLQRAQTSSSKISAADLSYGGDPFANIWLHAGFGVSQTLQSLSLPNGSAHYMSQRGFQVSLGIDILGPNLTAEGAVRNFPESDESTTRVSLREFDLKTYLKTRPTGHLTLRGGLGLGARDLSYKKGPDTFESSTPVSLVSLGADYYVNSRVSLGAEVSARNAMVSEGFDRSSYDATLRMDTHF